MWTSRGLLRLGLCSPDCHCRKPPHQPVGSWLLVTQRAWEALCSCTHVWIFSSLNPCFLWFAIAHHPSPDLHYRHGSISSERVSFLDISSEASMALHALSLPTPLSLIFSSRLSHSGSSVSKRDFTALI